MLGKGNTIVSPDRILKAFGTRNGREATAGLSKALQFKPDFVGRFDLFAPAFSLERAYRPCRSHLRGSILRDAKVSNTLRCELATKRDDYYIGAVVCSSRAYHICEGGSTLYTRVIGIGADVGHCRD